MTVAEDSAQNVLYALRSVAELSGATAAQLRRWNRSGLLKARCRTGSGLWYEFADVVAARAAMKLLKAGVRTKQVREAVEGIRAVSPDLGQPLANVRIYQSGGELVVQTEEGLLEPSSGQLVITFDSSEASEPLGKLMIPTVLQPENRQSEAPLSAEEWMRAGIEAESAGHFEEAEQAYRRCLSLEPSFCGALLNLGNLLYEKGRLRAACELYRAATRVADGYPEAWYNLANALDDLGQIDEAKSAYSRALAIDPEYADAHFNLALLLEKKGQRRIAATHWQAYLELEPDTPSAQIAQDFLGGKFFD